MWCAGSVAMIKDRSPDRARPCTRLREGSSQPLGAARRRFGRSSYSITASVGRVVSLNEILSHHRVVRGKRCNAQPRLAGPRTSAQAPICASSRHLGAARECARRSGYSVTVSVERVVSLIEGLSHHRVVRGQRFNAHAPLNGPLTPVHKLRDVLVPAPRRGARRRAEEVPNVSRCRPGASTH